MGIWGQTRALVLGAVAFRILTIAEILRLWKRITDRERRYLDLLTYRLAVRYHLLCRIDECSDHAGAVSPARAFSIFLWRATAPQAFKVFPSQSFVPLRNAAKRAYAAAGL